MTLPHFPPGTPEHRWMVEQVDAIITRWETVRDAARWTDPDGVADVDSHKEEER
jgi:hypothetical protein